MGDRLESLIEQLKDIPFRAELVQGSSVATIRSSLSIALVSTRIIAANPNRRGLILYNNGANSVYVALGSPANSNTNMTFIIATFAHLILPLPIYTGDIYGVRNAGAGVVLSTELT